MIDYQKELNSQQLEAVLATDGPYLVIAGAGSGKTRVLVYRTAYLVEKGRNPQNMLLLTFTRRAASEMLMRATELLDNRCQKVAGGTFHSFAHLMLRKYGEVVGLSPHFTILDQADAENTVNLIRSQKDVKSLDKRFPKKDTLLSIISKSINKCTDVESVVYEEYPHFMPWADVISSIKEGYREYKKNMQLVDYDDLLIYLRDLLLKNEDICSRLSQFYCHIMVDEYQDTNRIQAQIIELLAGEHKNVMVVGDDSQSIYSFRGANFRNIIDFPKKFPGTKVIMLEENYRSSQPILDLTNEVIKSASEKFEKVLFTQNKDKHKPIFVDTVNENSQSKYILKKIMQIYEQGVPLNEIAILFRSGWHSNDLEVELASHGIHFLKYGGQKFVEAAHIKDVLSYLRVLYNPLDEISWLRTLMLLSGIGEKTAAQVIRSVVHEHKMFDVDPVLFQKKAPLKSLFDLYKKITQEDRSPEEILKIVLEFYYPLMMSYYDDYDKRLNDLQSLQKIVTRYSSLENFLADMALEPPEKSIVEAERDRRQETSLVLSTIHSAKGLEWHSVFVLFVAEGYLPSYQSLESEDAIEEERRLFYVATTRAKKNLYLLRPQIDRSPRNSLAMEGTMFTRISRFMEEGRILEKFVSVETDHSGFLSGRQRINFSDRYEPF